MAPSPSPTRPVTREDILEAAARIFRRKGYHAASMQDIARAVNLQKASLYHHVSSKQEILVALLDRALDLLIEQMQGVLAMDAPPEEKLRQAVLGYTRVLAENRDLAAVLLLEFRFLEPEVRERHVRRRDAYERLWRQLLTEGQQAGVFHAEDPSLAAKALLGMINWLVIWYRPSGPLTPQEIGDYFGRVALRSLVKPDCLSEHETQPAGKNFPDNPQR